MSSRIESLESRTFLSASSLAGDQATLQSSITALDAFGTSTYDTLRADVSGQTVTGHDKALAAKWANGVNSKYKGLYKADTAGSAAVNKDVAKLQLAESAQSTKPSTATQKKVTVAIAKLDKDAAKAQSAITADSNSLQAVNVSGLNAFGAAFSSDTQVQTDIGTADATSAADVLTIQTNATTVFTSDVSAIVASYTA